MNRDPSLACVVDEACADELAPALRLVFHHLEETEREMRVENALELVRHGELKRSAVLVARGQHELLGAMIWVPVPGAGGLLWPPQSAQANSVDRTQIEDLLVQAACSRLRCCGTKLAQALLAPHETFLGSCLERNGFTRITSLCYMRNRLEVLPACLPASSRVRYVSYTDADQSLFHQTLLATYENTCDCPEVNGVRSIDEIIQGHRSQGLFDPERWWLVYRAEEPAGVLLLTEMPDGQGWDLSYVGVVARARGQGLGRALIDKAIHEAAIAQAGQLTLAVDVRNRPAWKLYQATGFDSVGRRDVYLAVWPQHDGVAL